MCVYTYIYTHIPVYSRVHVCIYMSIYREREREKEKLFCWFVSLLLLMHPSQAENWTLAYQTSGMLKWIPRLAPGDHTVQVAVNITDSAAILMVDIGCHVRNVSWTLLESLILALNEFGGNPPRQIKNCGRQIKRQVEEIVIVIRVVIVTVMVILIVIVMIRNNCLLPN